MRKEHNRKDCFIAGRKLETIEKLVMGAMSDVATGKDLGGARYKIREAVDNLSEFKDIPRAKTLAKRLQDVRKSAHEGISKGERYEIGRRLSRASVSAMDLAHGYRNQYCNGSTRKGLGPFDKPQRKVDQNVFKAIFGPRR